MPEVTFLQQPDRGHVRQRLAHPQPRLIKPARHLHEQVHRPDHVFTQPHRQRLHRREPRADGGRGERRPPLSRRPQVRLGHRQSRLKTLQAWPLVMLQLEQFHQVRLLARRRDHPQRPR
jgi:hypothetical protein